MAEAVFGHLAAALPPSCPIVKADSAGTAAYHEHQPPDSRTMTTLEAHGVRGFDHVARKVLNTDFDDFDYILAMDNANLKDLKRRWRQLKKDEDPEQRIFLFGDFDYDGDVDQRRGEDIEDPYYGGDSGFEAAFEQCVRFSKGWFNRVLGTGVDIDKEGKVTAVEPKRSQANPPL
ncbi:hypothetical protein MMC10_001378 [Thelotrema lepadinum]|nr:hypothetical protein [Thelotrema lepadinum]